MTRGPLFGNILRFVLPLIATNLLQQLYHAADVMIVGLSDAPDAVGAVGSTGTYLGLIRNIFIGFSVGASVVTARYIGAKDQENVSRSVHTAICMGVLFGVIGGGVGILLARPALTALGYEGSLLTLGVRYSYIYLACMPFLSLTNILCAILHARGDTKTSLYVLSGTGGLNILLNLFFVLVLKLTVSGVAIATAIANLASAVILWIILAKKKDDCRICFQKLRFSKAQFGKIARIGFPAGLQNALFSVSNMIIQSSILEVNRVLTPVGSDYAPVVKGNAAAGSIENFFFSAFNATNAAAGTVTGQNVGCGNYRRIKRALWQICLLSSAIAIVMPLGCMVLRDPLLAVYGVVDSSEPLAHIAYEAAVTRMLCKWLAFVPYAIMHTSAGVLRGLGKSTTSAVISLVGTCAFRVLWIYTVFRTYGTLESIFLSYPISWVLTGAVALIAALAFIRRGMRAENEKTDIL